MQETLKITGMQSDDCAGNVTRALQSLPGVDKVDFELWSLVVSAVNGCGMCLEAHEKVLRDHGLSAEQVQAGVRIAATVHATARTLAAEEALAPSLAQAA